MRGGIAVAVVPRVAAAAGAHPEVVPGVAVQAGRHAERLAVVRGAREMVEVAADPGPLRLAVLAIFQLVLGGGLHGGPVQGDAGLGWPARSEVARRRRSPKGPHVDLSGVCGGAKRGRQPDCGNRRSCSPPAPRPRGRWQRPGAWRLCPMLEWRRRRRSSVAAPARSRWWRRWAGRGASRSGRRGCRLRPYPASP